jgi:hypothetical protein
VAGETPFRNSIALRLRPSGIEGSMYELQARQFVSNRCNGSNQVAAPLSGLSGLAECCCGCGFGAEDPAIRAQAKIFPWLGFSLFMVVAGVIALMIGFKVDPTPVFEIVSKITPN